MGRLAYDVTVLFAIGDIHGALQKLDGLLAQLRLAPQDQLIFLGDYVDRGPDSCGVIERLIEIRQHRPNTIFLRGNHDQGMIDTGAVMSRDPSCNLTVHDIQWWLSYGGRMTIASYGDIRTWWLEVPQSHWDFLESTLLEYQRGPYIFVHAGLVPPGILWLEDEDPRLWIRDPFLQYQGDYGSIVVHGHTPTSSQLPSILHNRIAVDTGAGHSGPLTAVGLEEGNYDPRSVIVIQSD